MTWTIRTKFLLWFLILSIVPLVAVTYYVTLTFQENLTRETHERSLAIAESTAFSAQLWLEEKVERLQKLAQLEEASRRIAEGIAEVEEVARKNVALLSGMVQSITEDEEALRVIEQSVALTEDESQKTEKEVEEGKVLLSGLLSRI